ncbi:MULTISPECIES: pyrroline-5-carboxylate reductase [Cellulophaga]|jgi:pyrroline-5-carboxylate reductase|uniref:Pyrroline-5-carboxylate reductase n=2 Tax=Cellulophaga baltica TaxID=76594 RepID=A0A1G7GYB8_9FLAO|nr:MULTISPECIES: pyrroline-5-carboxylate reductase [Cellulophaga]WFO15453.1 pyrroline-5-carboxylate reductase [Cellulophaga baltica 4]AIZ40568.1 pyrroline-5-carboxylate reductase [Cellulophaga baltica 18]MCR1025361.1 pyrroline-5-carboxylate reductase [Cellulophaga baltica]QXP50614.1 pyrroline-5-carboxylate reductase [Cellulophaga sp. HaHa_2_1]QXP57063.1 pyrroline-5-carboxylate reductase [Cellulophaga sp. HaHa_2_95]
MKIAIIGAGNLGLAIAKGILSSNGATTMYLTKRKTGSIEKFEKYGNVTVTSDNREAVLNSDILIFAVQPNQFVKILGEIKDLLTEKHVLISTITGFSIAQIEAVVGDDQNIIRSMPNTAISVGKSMTCICSNEKGQKRIELALAIFNRMGHSLEIPETQMQAATVICASGIAFWMRMIRATTQGAIQLGFDAKEAQELAMHTCNGAAGLLIESGSHPEAEIDRVTTPQGCTIQGLNEMEHQGLSSSLIQGIVASYDKISRIKEENK